MEPVEDAARRHPGRVRTLRGQDLHFGLRHQLVCVSIQVDAVLRITRLSVGQLIAVAFTCSVMHFADGHSLSASQLRMETSRRAVTWG